MNEQIRGLKQRQLEGNGMPDQVAVWSFSHTLDGSEDLIFDRNGGRLLVRGKALVPDAPRDGRTYGRRDAAWIEIAKIVGGGGGGSTGDGSGDGTQGPPGPPGPQGPAGPAGPKGDTGPQGIQGTAGPAGAQGDAGPQGNTGPQGPKGDTGATGTQGPAGPQGATGNTGATGAPGLSGPAGPTAVSANTPNMAALGTDGLLFVADAPRDGKMYVRQNGAWVAVTIPQTIDAIGA